MEKTERKTGGIAKFQEMSKDWENNPKILRKVIENMSEKIDELQAKAEAYDRIMSGGKKTLKEWANIFGLPVAMDKNLSGIVFDEIPELLRTVEAWRSPYGYVGKIPSCNIYYTGSWQDSLTLPDGWEEQRGKSKA